jgi:hypothetical protein
MKCRACWTDKAYSHKAKGFGDTILSWLGFVPLRCHHCYHKFAVFWPLTIGKQLEPPPRKPASPAIQTAHELYQPRRRAA